MARLQDFQTVTPSGSDKLLIVQSQGQGLSTLDNVGSKVANDTTISQLNTTSKKIVGAINEIKSFISTLKTVATSGKYTDLTNRPTSFQQIKNEAATVTNTFDYIGVSFTLTGTAVVRARQGYNNSKPVSIGVRGGTTINDNMFFYSSQENDISRVGGLFTTGILGAGTYYVWAKGVSASASNPISVEVMYL